MMEFVWLTAADPKTADCYALRQAVFVEDQGFREEFDEVDQRCDHLLALADGIPVAAARLYREGEDWHIGRICVRRDRRGEGLGRLLLEEAENRCCGKGGRRLVLGAQQRAEEFYTACGYRRCGPEYLDEGCPHVEMGKELGEGRQ